VGRYWAADRRCHFCGDCSIFFHEADAMNAGRRKTDSWIERCERMWTWIDSHDVDRHALSACVVIISAAITLWSMGFADRHPDNAATILAVMGPWSLAQAVSIKYVLEASASKGKEESVL
jgi:hypothetical protein